MGWVFEPTVISGCAALVTAYFGAYYLTGAHRERQWHFWPRAITFLVAMIVLLLALISPLDPLGETRLFSAHMVQHLLLLEVVAPLWVLGLPVPVAQRLLRLPGLAGIEKRCRDPRLSWPIGFFTLAFWHIPFFYDLALASDGLHALEHISFLVSAFIFWWPVVSPLAGHRMPTVSSILYLFGRMAANLMLGVVVIALPVGIYAAYAHRVLPLPFGLTPYQDKEIGGYLMWLPSLVVDVAAVPLFLVLLLKPAAIPAVAGHEEASRAAPAASRSE
ncbi:MAG: cytochrome c oxidase assembly protein [Terriglobales bacterium]